MCDDTVPAGLASSRANRTNDLVLGGSLALDFVTSHFQLLLPLCRPSGSLHGCNGRPANSLPAAPLDPCYAVTATADLGCALAVALAFVSFLSFTVLCSGVGGSLAMVGFAPLSGEAQYRERR